MNGFLRTRKCGVFSLAALMFAASIEVASAAPDAALPLAEAKSDTDSAAAQPAGGQSTDSKGREHADEFAQTRTEAKQDTRRAHELRLAQKWNESFKAFAAAREKYESIGEFDDAMESEWCVAVGAVEEGRRNYDAARVQYRAALEADVRRTGKPRSQPIVLLGVIDYTLGDVEAAKQAFEEGVAIDRERGTATDLAMSLQWLAAIHRRQKTHQEAAKLLREASDAVRKDTKATAVVRAEPLRRLSRVLQHLGEFPEALATAEEAMALFKQGLGPEASDTIDEQRHIEQVLKSLSDREQRRHLPHEFTRLQARFFEHANADAGKKRFYEDRSWYRAFEKNSVSKTDDGTDKKTDRKVGAEPEVPPFPDDGRLWLDPVEFRTQMDQAAVDVTHIHDLSDAAMDNLREVLAGLEAIDGNDRAAIEHLRAARSAKARSERTEIRVLNHLIALECYCGDDAAMLDYADELFAYTYRFADLAHRARADTASACDDPAQFERCRRYLELARKLIHKSHGTDHWRAAELCESYVYFYARNHDPRALDEADRMVEIIHDKLPADAPLRKYLEFTRATAYLTCGEPRKAESMLESLLAKFRAEQEPDKRTMASVLRSLARLDAHHGRTASARRRYDEAIALLQDDRHLRDRLRGVTRERDDLVAGKLTSPTTFD